LYYSTQQTQSTWYHPPQTAYFQTPSPDVKSHSTRENKAFLEFHIDGECLNLWRRKIERSFYSDAGR
jgi:hypothetical protein